VVLTRVRWGEAWSSWVWGEEGEEGKGVGRREEEHEEKRRGGEEERRRGGEEVEEGEGDVEAEEEVK
jgi:hypothetical protein